MHVSWPVARPNSHEECSDPLDTINGPTRTLTGHKKLKYPISYVREKAESLVERHKEFHSQKFEGVPQEYFQIVDVWNDRTCRLNREFRCTFPGCGRVYHKSNSIRNHLKRHTKERPYYCGICQKFFAQKGNLQRHIEHIHGTYFQLGEFQEFLLDELGTLD